MNRKRSISLFLKCNLIGMAAMHISLTGCGQLQLDSITPKRGDVCFSFSFPKLNNAQNNTLFKTSSIVTPAKVVISLEDSSGNTVNGYENKTVTLQSNGNGGYKTDLLPLQEGTYHLATFMVKDKANDVIFLTPKKDSLKAYLIENPLPVIVAAYEGQLQIIDIAIVPVDSPPKHYGYMNFPFTCINAFPVKITPTAYQASINNMALTTANMTLYNNEIPIFQTMLKASTNIVYLADSPTANYRLVVTKPHFQPQSIYFTNDTIKAYQESVLMVELPPE